ncbi:MAG: NUDIX hydrolase [Chitinophagales bacterium]
MKYNILKEEIAYNGFLKIRKGVVQHDSFFKSAPIVIEREYITKQDAVAILIYEKDTQSILLVKQFRYPTTQHNLGWLLEIPAGMMETNEGAVTCAIREVKEELGYDISSLEKVSTFYTSPGCISERINLFYAEVTTENKTARGGGLAEEKEDIELIKLSLETLQSSIENGAIQDAKSLIGIQWFLLNRKSF